MFPAHTARAAQGRFDAMLARVGEPKRREILDGLAGAAGRVSEDVLLAVKWLYANSPLSDWANYDVSLFLSCGSHGVFLREHSPYAGDLPEDLFLHYVLHSRVNDEELSDCRELFYRLLADRVRGLSDVEAVIEANYWCAEQVTYRSTDDRTISALGACRSGYGRCGEESAFTVNVLRSLGLPARQIYAPRWAHCDDNHAWVEVWCGGGWRYLGACEPEEVLDRGWFTAAAGRAMLIHSRRFGEGSGGEVISRESAAVFLNQLARYAEARRLTAVVKNEAGAAVEGARVSFEILNYAAFVPVAAVTTGEDGTAALTCGLGSIRIEAGKGSARCARTVFTPDEDRVELVLTEQPPVFDTWEDFVVYAPRDRVGGAALTEAQRTLGREKSAAAKEKRERRAAAMFDPVRAEAVVRQYGYSQAVYELLEKSRGNFDRLLDFLADGEFAAGDKEALLLSLPEKDWRDADPEVLREALAAHRGEVFNPYTVCPRILHEPLRKNRRLILDRFSEEQKAAFRAEPGRIWAYIQEHIGSDPDWEYERLTTCPAGTLAAGSGSPLSKKILFAAICRALGVAARLNPVDRQAEYDAGSGFVPVEPPPGGFGTLALEKGTEETWQYGVDFSVGLLAEHGYQTLDLSGLRWEGNRLTVPARAGDYRVITANRLPNGDQYAGMVHLRLEGGKCRALRLRRHEAEPEAMLASFALEDFTVYDEAGRPVRGRELTGRKAVLMWLEEGREPTEHLLGEMLKREAELRELPADIVLIVRGPEALENARVNQVLETFGNIRVLFDSFTPNVETLARRVYVDPEKLPLVIVTAGELRAVYASSGYNVGSGDMMIKICRLA